MEVKRQLDVLDRRLAEHRFLAGDEYSIADIATFPWYGGVALGQAYGDASTFLDLDSYANVQRWTAEIDARPAVQRGSRVNLNPSEKRPDQLRERHSAVDLD